MRRLVAYQGPGYARLYLDRLKPLPDHGKLLAETARHLAVRMSFEDVIRVAEAKIAPERFRRIEGEINAKDQPYVITEFLKPGIEELCQVLPPRLARAMVDYAEARLARHRLFRHGAEDHDGVGLSALLGAREAEALPPEELALCRRADRDRSLARARRGGREALARARARNRRMRALIKGYGDTWKRGSVNYTTIEARVIAPVLEGRIPLRAGIDAIASARTAALLDPEGESLAKALAAIDAQVALPMAAE